MATPTNQEQYLLELLNETRLDPLGSASRYISSYAPLASADGSIQQALTFFSVNGAALQSAYSALTPVGALAWNPSLGDSSDYHNTAMIGAGVQEHQVTGEASLGQRFTNFGYTGYSVGGENIYAYALSPLYAHAGFMVDWGNGPNGMQSPAGHRDNIMNAAFTEVGIGVAEENTSGNPTGPLVVTEDFGSRGKLFITGVAYNDSDHDNFYSVGEGRSDLAVQVDARSTTSWSSGGYSVETTAGSKTITLTGAGLSSAVTVTATISTENLKLDVVDGTTLLTSGSVSVSGPITELRGLGSRGLTLTTFKGDQTITGTRGNDTINGGDGFDTVKFSGNHTAYTVTSGGDGSLTVTGNNSGSDKLTGIEILHFADGDYHWDTDMNILAPGAVTASTNHAPVAAAVVNVTVNMNSSYVITIVASDPDGDILTYYRTNASNGTLTGTLDRGIFTYTPKTGFTGTDAFVVNVSDGKGGVASQIVQINVVGANHAPTVSATSQAVTTTAGTAKQVMVSASDQDGDTLTYTAGTAAHGTITGGAGGVFSYKPTTGYTGSDSFSVQVSDGRGGTVSQTINVTVNPASSGGGTGSFKLYASDNFVGEIGGNGQIFGTNAAQNITVLPAGDVQFDSSFNKGGDTLHLLGNASAYQVKLQVSTAILTSGGHQYSVPIGPTGLPIQFDDGIRTLRFDNASQTYKIGSQTLTGTAATINASPEASPLAAGDEQGQGHVYMTGGTIDLGGNFLVTGTNGAEHVVYHYGNVQLDASFNKGGDILDLPLGPGSFHAYVASGTSLVLISDLGTITIPAGGVGMPINFNGTELNLHYDINTQQLLLGNQVISADSAANAVVVGSSSGSTGGVSADVGSPASAVTLSLTTGAHNVTDDANVTSNVKISNFTNDDSIIVTHATSNDYSFANNNGDLEIQFNDGTHNNTILILGAAGNSGIFNEATAEAALGWNFITFA